MKTESPEDPHRVLLRERLAAMLGRAERASSWADRLAPLRKLINRDGHVPVRARLTAEDLDFLSAAREEVASLSALLIRLLDLHRPRDAGGITSDPTRPILRCRSCMWRWPCPTFRALAEALPDSHPATPPTETPATETPATSRTPASRPTDASRFRPRPSGGARTRTADASGRRDADAADSPAAETPRPRDADAAASRSRGSGGEDVRTFALRPHTGDASTSHTRTGSLGLRSRLSGSAGPQSADTSGARAVR